MTTPPDPWIEQVATWTVRIVIALVSVAAVGLIAIGLGKLLAWAA